MKRVLLDTNIYLNFYRTSDEVLRNIDIVIEVLEKESFELVLPWIVRQEFEYNKFQVVNEFIEKLQERLKTTNIEIPVFLRNSATIDSLRKSQKRLRKSYIKAKKVCVEKVDNPRSHINVKIGKLFSVARLMPEKQKYIDKAMFRYTRKCPPAYPKRKNKPPSLGDAVIWELALAELIDGDLIIISNDGDFASNRNEKVIDEYLSYEWTQASNKKLTFYSTLGEFINTYSKKKKVKKKIIEEEERGASKMQAYASPVLASFSIPTVSPSAQILSGVDRHGNVVSLSNSPSLSPSSPSSSPSAGVSNLSDALKVNNCLQCGELYDFNELHQCKKSQLGEHIL